MAFDLGSITSEKRLRAPRIILTGTEKVGKSEFAAGSHNPVFIPIKREEGIDDLDVPKFPVCETVNDVREALQALHTQQHDFGTAVIDSSSTLEALIWKEVCEKNGNAKAIGDVDGGYGKGEQKAVLIWQEIADRLDELRRDRSMASIMIGHVITERYDDPLYPSYDRFVWGVNKHARAMLTRWADSILFANFKTVVRDEKLGFHKENVKHKASDYTKGQRFLYTSLRPGHPGGGRGVYGRLPYELDLSWNAFMTAVQGASGQFPSTAQPPIASDYR
jgi:hypothetical protein